MAFWLLTVVTPTVVAVAVAVVALAVVALAFAVVTARAPIPAAAGAGIARHLRVAGTVPPTASVPLGRSRSRPARTDGSGVSPAPAARGSPGSAGS